MNKYVIITMIVVVIIVSVIYSSISDSCESEASKLGLEEGIIYVNDLEINFTSESESPNGDIDEDSLDTSKSVSVQKCYIVIDFVLQMATKNDSGETITIKFTIDNASAAEYRIDYADTSTNSATTSENVTTITATYSLPEKACSEKNVRLILSANPKTAGTANLNYEFSCDTKAPSLTLQNNYCMEVTQNTIAFGIASSFQYSLNSDLSSYEFVKIISTGDTDISINSRFNGLPVTSIAANAFYGKTTIESITLPENITSIGDYAFYKCASLTSINIPKKVTALGNYLFSGCTSLASITIPDKVTTIGEYAFEDCTSLTKVTIPYNVTTIGKYVFDGCSSLSDVTFENAYGWYYVFITHIELDVTDGSTNAKNFTGFWGEGRGYTWYRSDD